MKDPNAPAGEDTATGTPKELRDSTTIDVDAKEKSRQQQ